MTATQPPLFLPGWDVEPCAGVDERRPDFGALLDKACADYRAQQRRWVDAVRPDAVVDGRPAYDTPISIDQFRKGALMSGPPRQPLTRRQAEVLAAAEDGATLAVVATRVGIPRPQVAARLSEAYRRLGVAWMDRDDKRAAAVRVARRRGLLPSEGPQQAREGPWMPV